MPQLSLYISDERMELLKKGSHAQGISISRYANALMEKGYEAERVGVSGAWPPGYWESVYGCLADDDSFVAPDDPPVDYDDLDRELGLVH